MGSNKVNIDYISLPVMIGFTKGENFRPFVRAGIVPSILLQHNLFNNFFDMGGIIEIGCKLKLKQQFLFTTGLSYQHSFTSYISTEHFPHSFSAHQCITVSAGIHYLISREK